MAWYIDTSALVKLVTVEAETPALHEWVADRSPELVASELLRTELLRAGQRLGIADTIAVAEALDAIDYLPATPSIFHLAGTLTPADLRSLDAIHLATALDLADECDGIITYDDRLASAARANGVDVLAPN